MNTAGVQGKRCVHMPTLYCHRALFFFSFFLAIFSSSTPAAAQQTVHENTGPSAEEIEQRCPYPFERLIAELREEETGRRWNAAECLGEMKDLRAVEPLVQALLNERVPQRACTAPRAG